MTASIAPTIAPATYHIDPARSTIRFVSKALFGLFRVRGTFTVRDGTIVVAEDVARSTVTATVDAASIDTANTRRDKDLRSKKYLHTAQYPDIVFIGREVTPDSVTGVLHLHGTGQRISLTLAPECTTDGVRFTTRTRLDRYAFGVTGGKGLVARHVDVELDIVASRT